MYLIITIFHLNIANTFFLCFFFLATLAGGWDTKTFCAPTRHSGDILGFWDVHLQEIK